MADLHVIEPPAPDRTVIAYLEHLLERARAGEFSAISVAYVYRDGRSGHGHSDISSLATMAGAVGALQFDLLRDMAR